MKKRTTMLLLATAALTHGISCYGSTADSSGITMPVRNTIKIEASDSKETIIEKASHVVPTANQLSALHNEFIAFIHFGPNTFTRMEWGNGMEDPKVFDLKELDTDQWCEAIKAAGMKMVILTVKHHDGFVLWQSRYTTHGIMSSNFRNGKGDVLKDLSESCRKYGLKLGVYLSPADLFQIEHPQGLYGNLSKYTKRTIPRQVEGRPFSNKTTFQFEVDDYNEYFLNQLFEILTEYGPIHEVWFDGAHPKTKGGQTYNYPAWKELIHKLAPQAVIFGREDVRWCGNESGNTRKTEWNVIPYQDNPNTMTQFSDLTDRDLGSREQLYKGKYLHYQQAETNTSIREGWFYRDDTHQRVRSTDDVFDIYERAVGGNSTFLLNIPPNREGKFSAADTKVLNETGQRIRDTYNLNLLANAGGPQQVLDNNPNTYLLLDKDPREIVLTTPTPITINRFLIQEAVATHGERVEQHTLEAYIDGAWKEIAHGTNIGYKRILRFPQVTTNKLRVRFPQVRFTPAISNISAHYYDTRPPQVTSHRDYQGMVTIQPVQHEFNWNAHGENIASNLNAGYKIYYTTDGTEPTDKSEQYQEPFKMDAGQLKAVAILNNLTGTVHTERYGFIKKEWKLLQASSESEKHAAVLAFDEKPETYWSAKASGKHYLAVDLSRTQTITGIAYTPQKENAEGMISKGVVQVSNDGKTWKEAGRFTFGNLINDPTKRYYYLPASVKARYLRIDVSEIAAEKNEASIAELDIF